MPRASAQGASNPPEKPSKRNAQPEAVRNRKKQGRYAADDEFKQAYAKEKPRWAELAERLK